MWRLQRPLFAVRMKPVHYRRKQERKDHLETCDFYVLFQSKQYVQQLKERDEYLREAERDLNDNTLRDITFPISGYCGFDNSGFTS